LPTDLGHNVEFVAWPQGFIKPKASKLSEPFTWTFDTPGVYVYLCTPHVKAGMVAIVVVGNDVSNKDAVSELELFGESVPRLENFLAQI
jgi:pseudoazurin